MSFPFSGKSGLNHCIVHDEHWKKMRPDSQLPLGMTMMSESQGDDVEADDIRFGVTGPAQQYREPSIDSVHARVGPSYVAPHMVPSAQPRRSNIQKLQDVAKFYRFAL
jgi:hypothetical protein